VWVGREEGRNEEGGDGVEEKKLREFRKLQKILQESADVCVMT